MRKYRVVDGSSRTHRGIKVCKVESMGDNLVVDVGIETVIREYSQGRSLIGNMKDILLLCEREGEFRVTKDMQINLDTLIELLHKYLGFNGRNIGIKILHLGELKEIGRKECYKIEKLTSLVDKLECVYLPNWVSLSVEPEKVDIRNAGKLIKFVVGSKTKRLSICKTKSSNGRGGKSEVDIVYKARGGMKITGSGRAKRLENVRLTAECGAEGIEIEELWIKGLKVADVGSTVVYIKNMKVDKNAFIDVEDIGRVGIGSGGFVAGKIQLSNRVKNIRNKSEEPHIGVSDYLMDLSSIDKEKIEMEDLESVYRDGVRGEFYILVKDGAILDIRGESKTPCVMFILCEGNVKVIEKEVRIDKNIIIVRQEGEPGISVGDVVTKVMSKDRFRELAYGEPSKKTLKLKAFGKEKEHLDDNNKYATTVIREIRSRVDTDFVMDKKVYHKSIESIENIDIKRWERDLTDLNGIRVYSRREESNIIYALSNLFKIEKKGIESDAKILSCIDKDVENTKDIKTDEFQKIDGYIGEKESLGEAWESRIREVNAVDVLLEDLIEVGDFLGKGWGNTICGVDITPRYVDINKIEKALKNSIIWTKRFEDSYGRTVEYGICKNTGRLLISNIRMQSRIVKIIE